MKKNKNGRIFETFEVDDDIFYEWSGVPDNLFNNPLNNPSKVVKFKRLGGGDILNSGENGGEN